MAVFKKVEARQAPIGSRGIILWARENLFSSPLNIALTIFGIALLLWIIPPFVNWSIIDAHFAGTTNTHPKVGANWVFIKVKMSMFLYGFYPEVDRWRVKLAYALFLIVIAVFKYGKGAIFKTSSVAIYFLVAYILIKGGIFGLMKLDMTSGEAYY